MTEIATKTSTYEVMFLISQAEAADFGGVIEHIEELFRRSDAEVLALSKWDERRLAYEINKQKRGVYLLGYFRAATSALAGFERDCNLSERIMRVLVTKADHLTAEEIASADGREDLAVEAKLRAERAAERAEAGVGASVSLGAPVQEAEAAPEPAADSAAEPQADAGATETPPAESEEPKTEGTGEQA